MGSVTKSTPAEQGWASWLQSKMLFPVFCQNWGEQITARPGDEAPIAVSADFTSPVPCPPVLSAVGAAGYELSGHCREAGVVLRVAGCWRCQGLAVLGLLSHYCASTLLLFLLPPSFFSFLLFLFALVSVFLVSFSHSLGNFVTFFFILL